MKLRGRKQCFCRRYLLCLLRRRDSTDFSVVNFVGGPNRPSGTRSSDMPHPGVEEELAQEFSTGEFSAVSVDPATGQQRSRSS